MPSLLFETLSLVLHTERHGLARAIRLASDPVALHLTRSQVATQDPPILSADTASAHRWQTEVCRRQVAEPHERLADLPAQVHAAAGERERRLVVVAAEPHDDERQMLDGQARLGDVGRKRWQRVVVVHHRTFGLGDIAVALGLGAVAVHAPAAAVDDAVLAALAALDRVPPLPIAVAVTDLVSGPVVLDRLHVDRCAAHVSCELSLAFHRRISLW